MHKKATGFTLFTILLAGFFMILLFGPEVSVFGPTKFIRAKGKPVTHNRQFLSPVTGNDLTLKLINGDSSGKNRVTSATVVLNGHTILNPRDFKKKTATIKKHVAIGNNNTISVTLKGKPGTFITIGIYGLAPEPTASLSISPETILMGEAATLTWSTEYASSVTIEPGLGTVETTGSLTIHPTESKTYTLTATGAGGTASATAGVTVITNLDDQTYIYGRVFLSPEHTPLSGAVIRSGDKQALSDGDGYWKLMFTSSGSYKINITKAGYTQVDRQIYLDKGKEGVVADAYLTPRDHKTTLIGPEGGTHENTGGTVQVVIPPGALDAEQAIRVTRIASSKALPGDLNAGDNIRYPINFLFCADFEPDGLTFNTPVTIGVQNTWGLPAGTEIPFAYWDIDTQKWVPFSGMARVDEQGEWLEAQVSHFTTVDENPPTQPEKADGNSDTSNDKCPDTQLCKVGSSVNPVSGTLQNDFSIPGITTRDGDTGFGFVYNSETASPSKVMIIRNHHDSQAVNSPEKMIFKVNSPLVGGGSGTASMKNIHFRPQSNKYGMGTLMLSGKYPSGRVVKTGYQDIEFSFTNLYKGTFGIADSWGAMPTGSTGIEAKEFSYHKDSNSEKVFMVSRVESPYGKGWWLQGLQQLFFDGPRVAVLNGNGSYSEFEQGINYADSSHGSRILTANLPMTDRENMLQASVVQTAKQLNTARFYMSGPGEGADQTFVVDLGQVRSIFEIGLDFPQYWTMANVWDYIKISTSTDNTNWSGWSQTGEPSLALPGANLIDALDTKIKSPYKVINDDRQVRYIKFQLGFPSYNTAHYGSAIKRVFAIGNREVYNHIDENPWPRLSKDLGSEIFTLEESWGAKTLFNENGLMIEKIDPQGRKVTFQYSGEKLKKISYPGGAFMELFYDGGGMLEKIMDSSGRQTSVMIDGSGHVKEISYADDTKREFGYDHRGLMTMDKTGIAAKTYTWDTAYPVIKEVKLPNGGIRTIEAAVLTYLLNNLESSEDELVDFPLLSSMDGLVSSITYEDGREEKYLTGRGWSKKVVDGELKETVHYANEKGNRIPITIQTEDQEEETSRIFYNDDLQVTKIIGGQFSDTLWQTVDSNVNAYYIKSSETHTVAKKDTYIDYNEDKLVSRMRSRGVDTGYSYDAAKNLTTVIDNIRDKITTYTYNPDNLVGKVTYPDGKVTEMAYDAMGLLSEVKNNDGSKVTVGRNPRGEISSVTDEENRTVTMERDIMGRVLKETSPTGRSVRYEWGDGGCVLCGGSSGKLTKIIDSGNKEWEFKYDIMGNATEMIYPDGSKIKQKFDISNRLELFTNKRAQEISYEYDVEGRLFKKITPEGDVVFTYDDEDRVASIEASNYHYTYDYGTCYVSGWGGDYTLVKETDQKTGLWTQHITNQDGLPALYFDSTLWSKGYQYNFSSGSGTPIGFTPTRVWYGKKGIGQRRQVYYTYNKNYQLGYKYNSYQSFYEIYSRDTNGLLNRIRYKPYSPGSMVATDLNLVRDASGLITSMNGDKALSVNYNNDLEITGVNHSIPQAFSESYSFDSRGNRLTSAANSFIYDDLNRLTETATSLLTYDDDGNMAEEKDKATGAYKKYTFSSENRLTRLETFDNSISPPVMVAEYSYDIYGRRIKKTVNGEITHFLWEDDNIGMELNGAMQPLRRYVYGVGIDSAEGHFEYSENPTNPFSPDKKGWYSYVKDQVGTIYKTYNHFTKQTSTTTYDSFGNTINQSGTPKGNLGFQSKYQDPESGLYYYYHRYYNPSQGRFINEDPIGLNGGLNMFQFVGNDPINWIDPYGLWNEFVGPGKSGKISESYNQLHKGGVPGGLIPPHSWPEDNFDLPILDMASKGIFSHFQLLLTGDTDDCRLKQCYEDCMDTMHKRSLAIGVGVAAAINAGAYYLLTAPHMLDTAWIWGSYYSGTHVGCVFKCGSDLYK